MKFFPISSLAALCAASFLFACSAGGEQSSPSFEDSWVRPVPPGMKMTAGFGILRNPGEKELVFNSFTSPEFGEVSLHRTETVNGMSKMREVGELRLASGGHAALEPGGYHLMLMMPLVEIQAGSTVTVEMTTEDGRVFRFEVPVERR